MGKGETIYTFTHFTAILALMLGWCWWANTPHALNFFDDVLGLNTEERFSCGSAIGPREFMLNLTLPTVVFWVVSYGFMIADLSITDLKHWKLTYPRWTNRIDQRLIRKAASLMIINTTLSALISTFVIHPLIKTYRAEQMCSEEATQMPRDLWGVGVLFARFFGVYILTDVIFYSTHRLCHESRFLYKHVHKVHHQFIETYAIDAAACHPVEHWFVNIHTVALPSIICGIPFHLYTAWVCIAMLNTCIGHCGYKLGPVTPNSHDEHHHFLNCQYGTDVFCDRIFGTTYKDFLARRGAKGADVIVRA